MASGALNPIDYPQAWDVVVIGNVESPGLCKVGEAKRKHEWDVKKGKGSDGATITYVGKPPGKVTLTFTLWTRDHFKQWETFRPLFKYDPTKKAITAVDVYHPSLADIGLKSFVTESISNITHEGYGKYVCTVELLEYSPPPKGNAVATPTTSKTTSPGTTPGTPPDPVSEKYQKQIQAELDEMGKP